MPLHLLANFQIQKYYHNEPKFKGLYLIHYLSKIKDWAYVLNFHECRSIETHWIALYVDSDDATYFHSFRVDHISKEIHRKQKFNNEYI